MGRTSPSAVLWQTELRVVAGFVCGGVSCKVPASVEFVGHHQWCTRCCLPLRKKATSPCPLSQPLSGWRTQEACAFLKCHRCVNATSPLPLPPWHAMLVPLAEKPAVTITSFLCLEPGGTSRLTMTCLTLQYTPRCPAHGTRVCAPSPSAPPRPKRAQVHASVSPTPPRAQGGPCHCKQLCHRQSFRPHVRHASMPLRPSRGGEGRVQGFQDCRLRSTSFSFKHPRNTGASHE